jgi:hypothetical protein
MNQWRRIVPSKADRVAAAQDAEAQAKAALEAAIAEPTALVAPRTYADAAVLAEQEFQRDMADASALYQGKAEHSADYEAAVQIAFTCRRLALADALKLPGAPASAPNY